VRPEPPGAGSAERVVRFAAAQIGKKYCWGGVGPECFDCSGLVQQSWRAVGVRLPRTADAIASTEPEVPLEDARMGDVLWWPGHVGIYAGYGWVIDAYDSRHGVVRRPAGRPRRAFRPVGLAPHPAPLSQSFEQRRGRAIEVGADIEDDVRSSGID
jgi:cell wall-associated NlpC family hydrolase